MQHVLTQNEVLALTPTTEVTLNVATYLALPLAISQVPQVLDSNTNLEITILSLSLSLPTLLT